MGPASSDASFTDHLDQTIDTLKFVFNLPAEYPGGRVGLLRNIRDMLDSQNPFGIVETHVGQRETSRFLGSKSWTRQHDKDQRWTNAPKAYNWKVGCAQFSSQYFFKFLVSTGESALLVVDKNADGFKSAVDQHRPLQQQFAFMQLMTLPVRVWMCIQYRQDLRCGDASQGREPRVDQPGANAIRDASSLCTYEGSSTGISGELKKLTDDATKQAAHEPAGVEKLDESVTGEQPGPDSQSPEQSVVLPSEGKTEENKEMSKKPLDKSESTAENFPMGNARWMKNKRRKLNLQKRKALLSEAAEGVQADAQPQQQQPNDEQSAFAASGTAGQNPVIGTLALPEDELRSPTSASASFGTAHSPSLSRISTSSRNFHTPPLVPNDSFTGESVEEGVPALVGSDFETTSLPGGSREPSQEGKSLFLQMISPETITGARRESDEWRSAATSTLAKSTTHPPEIFPRSERESPIPTSKVEPVLGPPSEPQAVGGKWKKWQKWKSKKPKNGQDPVKPEEDELDDTRAATAHVEARQQEISPQDMSGITDQPLHPRADPSSGPATRHQSPMKDKGKQRASDITALPEALQSLDLDKASTAYAGDPSSVSGSVTPGPTSRQSLVTSPESAEIRLSSAAAVSASHPQRNKSSSAANPTQTLGLPPRPAVTVGRPTRRGEPTARVAPATTLSLSQRTVVPARGARTDAPPTYAHPAMTPGFNAAVPAGSYPGGGFVSGANPTTTPGPMMAAVPAGPHGGFAPSPTVAPGYGAYQQSPSQKHQASTPAGTFWVGNPAASPFYPGSSDPQTSGGGAYPTPPTMMTPAPASAPGNDVVWKKKEIEPKKSFWDLLTRHTFECAMEGCEKQCSLWDSKSVICPFCGPFSLVQYCGKEHLREDVRDHWQYCGQAPMEHPCVEDSVPRDVLVGPPAIPCKNGWDSPERHRQAIWFSTACREGDYFIFADWQYCAFPSMAPDVWRGRCSPRVMQIVRFDDPIEKDRFRRILAVCLLESVEVQPLVVYMFRLLRDKLQSTNQWSDQLDLQVRQQLFLEQGVSLDPNIVGQQHACETEWNGRSPRHCRDPICVAERRHFSSGFVWAQWLERLVFNEECSHWILRANRTTHPTVHHVYDRTGGEGFDVVEEEKRLFRRGEGWDGAGTGPMEMEGSEVY